MCYTGKCPYEYGRDGDMCHWLQERKPGEFPPDDAWCGEPNPNEEVPDEKD